MANFLKKNLELLSRLNSLLAKEIERTSPEGFEVVRGKRNFLTLKKVSQNGEKFYHSLYDPCKEASQLLEDKELDKADGVLVLGFGLGYHIEELLKHIKEDVPVLVLEKHIPVLRAALQAKDFSFLLKRKNLTFFVPGLESLALEMITRTWLEVGRWHRKNWKVVSLPAALQEEKAWYHEALESVRNNVIIHAVLAGTKTTMALLWPLNTARNIAHILNSMPIGKMEGAFKGLPLFLVAAGPSLELEYENLKKALQKGIVCAVGTSYRVLLQHGITPHFVVSIDAGPLNFKHFEGIENDRSFLIYDPIICPEILEKGKEKRIVCQCIGDESNPPLSVLYEQLEPFGVVEAGFSVATMGLGLGKIWQCNPLVLIGQDLSFPKGKTHASGTALYRELNLEDEKLFSVPANSGGEVKTQKAWLSTKTYFEERIPHYPGKVYNTSKLGAKIKGAEFLPLEELFETLPSFNPEKNLNGFYKPFSIPQEKVKRMKERFEKIKEELHRYREEADFGLHEAEELYLLLLHKKTPPSALRSSVQKKIDRLKPDPIRKFIEPYFFESRLFLQRSQADIPEDQDPLLWEANRAGVFFESLSRSADIGIDIASICIQNLKRLERKEN